MLHYKIFFCLLVKKLETDKDALRFQMNYIFFILFFLGITTNHTKEYLKSHEGKYSI